MTDDDDAPLSGLPRLRPPVRPLHPPVGTLAAVTRRAARRRRARAAATGATGLALVVATGLLYRPEPVLVQPRPPAGRQPTVTPGPGVPSPAVSGPSPAGAPPCRAEQLTVRLGATTGAAGTFGLTVVFTNAGERPCSLKGVPRVAYVTGRDGGQLGPAAQPDRGRPAAAVVVRAGKSASATVLQPNPDPFDPQQCQPAQAGGRRVTPPGAEPVFVPAPRRVCTAPATGRSQVTPVVPGSAPL